MTEMSKKVKTDENPLPLATKIDNSERARNYFQKEMLAFDEDFEYPKDLGLYYHYLLVKDEYEQKVIKDVYDQTIWMMFTFPSIEENVGLILQDVDDKKHFIEQMRKYITELEEEEEEEIINFF
jgi:hypothetical protein